VYRPKALLDTWVSYHLLPLMKQLNNIKVANKYTEYVLYTITVNVCDIEAYSVNKSRDTGYTLQMGGYMLRLNM